MSGEQRHPRVLIVDDEPDVLAMIAEILGDHDVEVVMASSGLAALREAARERFDLCVLDVTMPNMDGLEVCRRLRALPFTQDLRVLFMTAHQDAQTIDAAFAAGGTDYLFKPVVPTLLWARVNNVLRTAELRRKADHVQEALELLGMALHRSAPDGGRPGPQPSCR